MDSVTVVAAARYRRTRWQRVELVGRGRSVREGEVQFPWREGLAELRFPTQSFLLSVLPLS